MTGPAQFVEVKVTAPWSAMTVIGLPLVPEFAMERKLVAPEAPVYVHPQMCAVLPAVVGRLEGSAIALAQEVPAPEPVAAGA